MAGKYRIFEVSKGVFELYEGEIFLAQFTRATFREKLEGLSRGSNWIGSILRLLNQKYPLPLKPYVISSLERVVGHLGERGIADYLRSKGLRVIKELDVPDRDLIKFLELEGYIVEGLVEGNYYSTKDSALQKVYAL